MNEHSSRGGGSLNRRDLLKTAGAALVVGAFGLPGRAAPLPGLKIYLATASRPCRRFFLRRLRPVLQTRAGLDPSFPLVHHANLYANPRRTVRTLRTLLAQQELDFAVVPESLLPVVLAMFPERLVDLSGQRLRMESRRVDFLPTEDAVFAFNLLDQSVTLALSTRASDAAGQLIDAIGEALSTQVLIRVSGPHRADGVDVSIVDIRVTDPQGNPFSEPVFLAVRTGGDEKALVPTQNLGGGSYQARVTSDLAGVAEMVVTDGTGRVLDPAGAAQTTFEPGPLSHWLLTPVRPVADANGSDRAVFRLQGFDDLGNLVPRSPADVMAHATTSLPTVSLSPDGNLELAVSSTRFGQSAVEVVDRLTGVTESLVASFPRLRLGDGQKLTVVIPTPEHPGPPPVVDVPLIAGTAPGEALTGYDVMISFDSVVCAIDEVLPASGLATSRFTHAVKGGWLTVSHRFSPVSGSRVQLATIRMSALTEGAGVETIATPGSRLMTLSGALALTPELVFAVEKEHKKIEKTIKLKVKIVKGTGGASLGTDAEAMDKVCKAVDNVNRIYCQAKIKFEKEVSTINCDLGANGLDEYKKDPTAEEKALIDKCKPKKGEIVAFVVGKLSCGSNAESFSKGQFPGEVANGRTGTCAIDDDFLSKNTLAHEIGHLLLGNGDHVKKADFPTCKEYEMNLMHPSNTSAETLTEDQIKKIKDNACAGTGF